MFKIVIHLNVRLDLKFIAFLVLSFYGLDAQTDQDSSDLYDKMIEGAALKLTIAYIEDLRLDDWNKGKIISKKEKDTYDSLLDLEKKNDKIDSTTIRESLDNGDWREARRKIYDEYNTCLKRNEHPNFQNIEFIPSGVSNSRRQQVINQLNYELKKSIEQSKPNIPLPQILSTQEKIIENNDTGKFGLNYALLVFLL